jgi:predicted acetyltransferase
MKKQWFRAGLALRFAQEGDIAVLSGLNHQLIRDEGHRNPMTVPELEERMRGWIESSAYQAVMLELDGFLAGYALFRREPAPTVYLRQFFICRDHRRQGIGRRAIALLLSELWQPGTRVIVDVLVGNKSAIAFWKAVGFVDYSVCLEMFVTDERSTPGTDTGTGLTHL